MSATAEMRDQTTRAGSAHPLRPISFGDTTVTIERRADGTIYLRPTNPIGDYPTRLTDYLHHWAREAPDRVFMAERNASGGWREIRVDPAKVAHPQIQR